jgi:uncharacterized protein (DUF924 family)
MNDNVPYRNKSPHGWWIASYVQRACWDDEPKDDDGIRGRVWENTILLQAEDREAAYDKAVRLARDGDNPFDDGETDGRKGQWCYVGLSSLLPIYDELDDGVEVLWTDHGMLSFREAKRHVKNKHALEAFDDAPISEEDDASDEEASGIVRFWRDAGPAKWFAKDTAFDAELRARFLDEHFAAARREREHLLDTPDGALALILLLDQVPRNVFRDSAHAFATDPLALAYARRAIDAGFDTLVDPALRVFVYLPLEHSEDIADQDRCVALCEAMGDANYLKYAEAHRDVIRRFGRFPHRNRALARESTPEESAWLEAGGGF